MEWKNKVNHEKIGFDADLRHHQRPARRKKGGDMKNKYPTGKKKTAKRLQTCRKSKHASAFDIKFCTKKEKEAYKELLRLSKLKPKSDVLIGGSRYPLRKRRTKQPTRTKQKQLKNG